MYRFSRFSSFASRVARNISHPATFILVLVAAGIWLATGPLFHFSENWYFAYSNTATIVTTLLLFLIQHTQSREMATIQLKLNEIIRVSEGAHNALLDIEELTDRDYDQIKSSYTVLAKQAREQLRGGKLRWATARVSIESLDSLLDPTMARADEEREEAEQTKQKANHTALHSRLAPSLDRITRIAAQTSHTPMALLAIADGTHGWLQSEVGMERRDLAQSGALNPLAQFLFEQVSESRQPLTIADAGELPQVLPSLSAAIKGTSLAAVPGDGKTADAGPNIAAVLAVPLMTANKRVIGCLCVLDVQPRRWQDTEVAALQDLAITTVEQSALQARDIYAPNRVRSEAKAGQGEAASSRLPASVQGIGRGNPMDMASHTQDDSTSAEASEPAAILVVDDSATNRTLLQRRLEREGYRVVTASNGQEAMACLETEPVGLTLLDVMMPEMDGEEVLQRMQASDALRKIPVIMVSALDEQESVQRCLQAGARDYLLKPFDPAQLRARVHAYLPPPGSQDAAA